MNRRLLSVLFALLVMVAGCGKGSFSERASHGKESVFRYPLVAMTTRDPHMVEDGDTIDVLQQMFEGLVGWNEKSQVEARLAESLPDPTDNGTVYTFKIRQGVKFHNGKELTAEDVKWSFERVTNRKLASPVAETYLGDIVGVKEKLAGSVDELAGVRVIDQYTVQIRIRKRCPYFLGKLTYPTSAVLPNGDVPADKVIVDTKQMIGTGPFKMSRYEENQLVVLGANADYYGIKPSISAIERPIISDAQTRLNKYRAGELDLVMLERQDVKGIDSTPKLREQLKFFPRPAIWYIGLNQLKYKPFADRRVRQAFAMAIDKNVIVKEILGNVNMVANGILPPGVPGYRENPKSLPYDIAAARRLLAEAGYPGGKGLPPLEMTFRDSRPDARLLAENAASQLSQNLGVKVNPRSMEWGVMLEKKGKGELALYHIRWMADYLDPNNFLSMMLVTGEFENTMGYSNHRFDALCAKADSMPEGEDRLKLYAEAEDIALQDAPWIPVYFQKDAELIAPRVQGLRESLFGHLPHTTVRLNN